MKKNNLVLSIDWDHTLRNASSLNKDLLALIFYAKLKKIPVGLTTHRDRDNTRYYLLYDEESAQVNAFPAAISYWHEKIFAPLAMPLDFINARFQPEYHPHNYYAQVLLPYEALLMTEISHFRQHKDVTRIRRVLEQQSPPAEIIGPDNHFKQMQIKWLAEQYPAANIVHIDDDFNVFQNLPSYFDTRQVETFLFEDGQIISSYYPGSTVGDLLAINDDLHTFNQAKNLAEQALT